MEQKPKATARAKLVLPAEITYFKTPADFRSWFERHHASTSELWVGFYKKSSGTPSITWPESVDAALCFGWIDGVRKMIDAERYVIRFTPRKASSTWSSINHRRIQELIAQGLVQQAGLNAFERREEKKTGIYSYEQRKQQQFEPAHEKIFRKNKTAWTFFQAQPPGYRAILTWWVLSAKQEATRLKRLDKLIDESAHGRRMR
ncbi:MAG TPA: YdeI/OmpD-associated family protein [Opitutaceae bacterium]|nr:YdeI/OmpD-associated family protein [Opitutaceae bacterium]